MIVLDSFDHPAACFGGVLAIGNFDGVHRGHQRMLSVLTQRAKEHNVPAIVLTFDPPPVQLLRPDKVPPRLTTLSTKQELIAALGVDCLIVYPTDLALLNLDPYEFFEQIVVEKLGARGMVEGPNFFFGKDRQGNVELLAELCQASGRQLDIIKPEYEGEVLISSSTIRKLIAEGNLTQATRMLGHPYRVEGRVVQGAMRGRTLGFPTANLAEIPTLLPGDGVYAGRAFVQGQTYLAAVHVGSNPTFGTQERKVEVHLLEFSGQLYGQSLTVDLVEQVRGTQVFQDAQALKNQIEKDLSVIRRLANSGEDR